MTRSAHSTAPAESTQGAGVELGLAIAWVAPVERVTRLELDEPARPILLGRDADSVVPLSGTQASRRHAEIVRDGPLWVIRDLQSRNGTFVDGERRVRAALGPRTVIRIGDAVGVVVERSADEIERPLLAELGPGFWGGATLSHIIAPLVRVAAGDLPVIIEGETGTGKERVARFIHEQSGRRGPFVALNCAALPESLAEAELFGYRRGAFTGAERASPGHLRAANGGTLFLDEIIDLPLPLQAKLLRALEQREVLPLGEAAAISVDVRVVVATQVPLSQAVGAGRFRGDLFARLDGFSLRLPPLRERIEEAPLLFSRFLRERSGGHPPALEARLVEVLCLHDWPFNVRELEFLVRRLLTLHGHEQLLRHAHLPERVHASRRPAAAPLPAAGDEIDRFLAALREHGGVVARAAAAVGISRPRAYRLMAEHELEPGALRPGRGGQAG